MLTFENDRFRDVEMTLPTGHFYRGRSVGGEETCHQFPGLDFAFDIGYAPMSATSIGKVFVSHGHADHAGGLARHATRRHGRALSEAQYYVPGFVYPGAVALFHAMELLEGSPRSGKLYRLDGFGEEADVVQITQDRYVVPFKVKHRIPCFGYLVWQTRKRLSPKFVGLAGSEIAALVRKGEQVNETVEVPDIAYCGDTTIDALKGQPDVRRARLLLLECTMLEDSVSVADTRRAGHVHLDEIIQQADLLAENECVMLTHFSARYRSSDVRRILAEKLPASLKEKVIPLLPEPRP